MDRTQSKFFLRGVVVAGPQGRFSGEPHSVERCTVQCTCNAEIAHSLQPGPATTTVWTPRRYESTKLLSVPGRQIARHLPGGPQEGINNDFFYEISIDYVFLKFLFSLKDLVVLDCGFGFSRPDYKPPARKVWWSRIR